MNKGLILPDLVVNLQNIQAQHVLLDQFYLDSTNACTNYVTMPQPRQLICLWNKNRFPKYSQF